MKKALNRVLLILLILSSKSIVSQIDTVFWFAAPWVTPGHAQNTPVKMRLSSFNNLTTVRVRQPAGTFDTTYTIPANALISQSLSHIIAQVENVPANTIHNRGLKVTSNFPINVVYEVETVVNNPETFSLKGQNGMGKEFVCPFQNRGDNGPYSPAPKSQICIVATDNNTTVWITPKCNVVGHAANITYSITLNVGQSYNVENVSSTPTVPGQNLSGTIVVSDKPISVTVADDSVHGVSGCYDLMGDQIVSVDIVGTQYVINKGGLSVGENEGGYIVATENFTQVNVNDGVTTYSVLLNKGDTYYAPVTQPLTYVTADQNIYVIHTSGFGCEMGEAILPPLNCAGSNQVSFTRTNTQTFILNILCKTTAVGSFTLNGSTTLVPASGFTLVPGTGGTLSGFQRSYTTVEIPAGTANLLTNSIDVFSMGVINGGSSSGCLYHYMSSFLRKTFTVADPDKNICTATTTLSLNGTVTGGSTTGIWTTPNGTGTFGNPTSLVTTYTLSANDLNQSQIKLILSSTGNCTPIRDTVLVNIFKSPIVDANNGLTLCKNNISPVVLNGTLQFAAGANWTSSGTGSFGNFGSLNTTYLPSPADLIANSVKIKLTSTGSLNGCPNTYDSLVVNFINPPVVATSGDVSVCANNPTVAITGTVSAGTFTTGTWSTTGSGLFSPNTNSLSTVYQLSPADIAQGNIVIRLTSTNNLNCNQVYDSLRVTITPKPNVNAGINDTICSSNVFYPLNGSVTGGASAGTWTSLGNGSFGNSNNLSTVYTLGQNDTINGVVKLVLTSTGSNCLPETDTITVIIAKSPLVNAGPDNAVCDNQLIVLNGSVFGLTTTGVWTTLGTGAFTPDDSLLVTYYQPSPLDVAAGFVRLVLTSTYNKGCAAIRDTIRLNFKPAPVADFNSNNACAKKLATFTDNSTTSSGTITGWSWNFGDLGTSIAEDATHAYTNPGTYTVTHVVFSNNGCRDTIQRPISIYFLPQAMFYQNTPCVGNATQFVDSSKTQSGSLIAWNWEFGDNSTSGIQNPTHAYSSASNYTVSLIVTSSFGCKDTVMKQITVIPGPDADFSVTPNPLEALETGNFTDLSTGPSALVTWYWGFGDESASNQQNPTHSYSTPGDYSVYLAVKDINGCIDTVRKDITVVLMPDVPTAFSPNNDGQNDFFRVRGGPFKSITVRVYNNWGQLIFETNDQLEGWNGTFNGTEQPIGVYVWVVDVEMLNGKIIKKTGDVTLLR
jgi:gliding motility-associated-like protein